MLAVTERPLLSGPASTIEATYPLKHGSCRLGDLVHFLRICCEELIRYCVWPVSYSNNMSLVQWNGKKLAEFLGQLLVFCVLNNGSHCP